MHTNNTHVCFSPAFALDKYKHTYMHTTNAYCSPAPAPDTYMHYKHTYMHTTHACCPPAFASDTHTCTTNMHTCIPHMYRAHLHLHLTSHRRPQFNHYILAGSWCINCRVMASPAMWQRPCVYIYIYTYVCMYERVSCANCRVMASPAMWRSHVNFRVCMYVCMCERVSCVNCFDMTSPAMVME
jgi:hypothetical protein